MKKYLVLLFSVISLTAFSQSQPAPKTGGVALRVNDSTSYISTQTTGHSQGYADIFWNNQATTPHYDIWNGSSYDHVFDFNAGGGGGGTQDLQDVLDNGASANIGDAAGDITAQDASNYTQFGFAPGNVGISSSNNANTQVSGVEASPDGLKISDTRANRGIQGEADYSANIQANDYTQKAYVDAIAIGDINGLGSSVATVLGVNVGTNGAFVVFGGAGGAPASLTLTNATGLPGTSVVNTPAGNIASTTAQAAINELDTEKAAITSVIGAQDIWIPASAMWPRSTTPCADLARTEMATSLVNIQTLDFDPGTQEYAQFSITLPRNWNNGTITVKFKWTAASGSGDVVWSMKGGAYSDNDALTTALGTAQTATDTQGSANTQRTSSATSAITIAGTPADEDLLFFEVSRVAADGGDTLGVDAKLIGVFITITTDNAVAN